MTDGGGHERSHDTYSIALEMLKNLDLDGGVPPGGVNLTDLRRLAVRDLSKEDMSGTRIQDLVDEGLRYTELYKGGNTKLKVYMDFCRAFDILFDIIPRHPEYETFLNKTKSPFLEVFLDLCSVVANEDVKVLEDDLSLELRNMKTSWASKTEQAHSINVLPVTGENSQRTVRRKPVGSPASGPSPSATPQIDDPLKARFARLRSGSKTSKEIAYEEEKTANGSQNRYWAEDYIQPHGDDDNGIDQQNGAELGIGQDTYDNGPLGYSRESTRSPSVPPPPAHPPPPIPMASPRTPNIAYPRSTVIHAEALAKYLKLASESILVLDLRPRNVYDQGHVEAVNIVCIEPVSLRQNMKDDDIEDGLVLAPEEELQLFARRDEFELVVYYDASSRSNAYKGGPAGTLEAMTLYYLTSALYQRGFAKPLRRYPCLLVGGYEAWVEYQRGKTVERTISTIPAIPAGMPSRPYGARKGSIPSSTVSTPSVGYARDYTDYLRSMPSLTVPAPTPQTSYSYDDATERRRRSNHYRPQSNANMQYSQGPMMAPSASAYTNGHVFPPSQQFPDPRFYHPGQSTYSGHHFFYPNGSSSVPRPAHFQSPIPSPQSLAVTLPVNALPPPSAMPSPPPHAQRAQVGFVACEFTTGLKNLGNTCYMNCVLQCLAGTPSIAIPFVDGTFRRWVNVNSRLGHKGILAHKFAELVQLMFCESYSYVAPSGLKDLCGRIREQFMGFEQQDSQEFLTFLLDGLHEDLNSNGDKERLKNLTDEEEHRREQMTVRLASTIEWERYLKSNFSLIVDTVQGQLQSRLRCLTCNHTSTTYSAFSCLSLPIPLGYRQVTLHDCFNLFTGEEILDGDDAWICPKCKRSRRTSKILRIARLPSILIIHLKRFAQRGGRGYSTSDKLETFVTYPTSHLDLTPYWPKFAGTDEEQKLSKLPVRGQTDPFIYNLYAVANHFGSLKGGHYTAFVKKTNKGWCYFDDTRIMRQQPESAVINNNAYVLFYERQKSVR